MSISLMAFERGVPEEDVEATIWSKIPHGLIMLPVDCKTVSAVSATVEEEVVGPSVFSWSAIIAATNFRTFSLVLIASDWSEKPFSLNRGSKKVAIEKNLIPLLIKEQYQSQLVQNLVLIIFGMFLSDNV